MSGMAFLFLFRLTDTVVRVSSSYSLAMHIDTDEANAAAIQGTVKGTIVEIK